MKVLIINTVPTEKNGITGVIFNMLNNISFEDLRVDYLAINSPDEYYCNFIKQNGGEVFVVPRQFSHPIHYIRQLVDLQKKNRYDIIHAHGNSSTLFLEMLAGLMGGCRYRIAHSHSTSCIHTKIHRILKPVFNLVCNGRIACSQKAGVWLFGSRKFETINNGVNLSKFHYSEQKRKEIREKYKMNENHILLGHVGDFHTDNKNQEFLVDLLADIIKKDDRFRLMLIGDGKLCTRIKEKVNILGLREYVYFTGIINNVCEYMNAFDVFLLPSKFEGVPLTVVEAQANGLPCIVSDTVSVDVDLTGRVMFVDIYDNLKVWERTIMEMPYKDRESNSKLSCQVISDRGYDLVKECSKLKSIYRKRMKK